MTERRRTFLQSSFLSSLTSRSVDSTPPSEDPILHSIPDFMHERYLALPEDERLKVEDQLPTLLKKVEDTLALALSPKNRDTPISSVGFALFNDGAEPQSSLFLNDVFTELLRPSVRAHNQWLTLRREAELPFDKEDA